MLATLPEPEPAAGRSMRVLEVEVSEPLPTVEADGHDWARILVRLHRRPLGTAVVGLADGSLDPARLAVAIREQLGDAVIRHLVADDADPSLVRLLPEGITGVECAAALESASGAPFVSVIVATRDRPERISACVDSLLRLDYPHYEVVVVDNAPADDATQRVVQGRYADEPRVRYEREPRPGVSHARNAGILLARGEIVAFVDDDEVVDAHWLAALVDAFGHDRVTCVTGLTLPFGLDTPAQRWFECYGGFSRGYELWLHDLDTNLPKTRFYPYTAGIFGGSGNVAFRRRALLEIGCFDPGLGGGSPAFAGEDLDAFLSILFRKDRIAYQPAAIVRHDHRADYASLRWQVFTYSAALSALVIKRMLLDPRVAADVLRRLPGIVPTALRARRGAGAPECDDYPRQLRLAEAAGYLYGPVAYVRSRWVARDRG